MRLGSHAPAPPAPGASASPPLGSAAGGVRLCDLKVGNRLDELAFDLPIRGGTAFRQGLQPVLDPAQLRAALGRSREDGNIPETYLALLRAPSFTLPALAGFLTGSIDLAYRVGTGDDQRWYVCDYKTNRVAPAWKGGPRVVNSRAHYTQPWLRWAMAHHHYYIQYHLYLLALHRYLSTRLPNYDYDKHIGGAVYLFLRGMSAEDVGAGVYVDKPPRSVIDALDACFRVPDVPAGADPGVSR
jgi:exodeoxyribonuclease V beta subunit